MRKELVAEVVEILPPRKKNYLKKKLGSIHVFDQFFFSSENWGHYYPDSNGWLQGTTKRIGLKRPSLGLKLHLML